MTTATIAAVARLPIDVAKSDLMSAEMMHGKDPAKAVNLFWTTFYNSEFVKCDIPYNAAEWENGTGYYDGAVTDPLPQLAIGEIGRSVSEKGRRILIVKTRFGNMVLFERYIGNEDGSLTGPIVRNVPKLVLLSEMFRGAGSLSVMDLRDALGDGWLHDNLGLRLENFFSYADSKVVLVD